MTHLHDRIRQRMYLLWLLPQLTGVVLLAYTDVWDFDIYYHLAVGNEILAGGIPSENVYIYTGTGQAFYPNAAWLFELGVYPLFQLGGFTALVLAKVLLVLLLFILLWRIVRQAQAPPALAATLLFVVAMACAFRFTERPHLLSHLFLAVFVLVVQRWHAGDVRGLRWLPLVMLVWANSHAGFVFGLVYLWLACGIGWMPSCVQWLPQWLGTVSIAPAQLRRLVVWSALTTAASFLNPAPLALYRSLWELANVEAVFPITEYQAPDLATLPWFYLLVAVLVLLACIRPWRHDPLEASPLLVFLFLAFSAVRFVPDFAIAALPWAGRRLSEVGRERMQLSSHRSVRWLRMAAGVVLPAVFIIVPLLWTPGMPVREFPVQPPHEAPLGATRFLAAAQARGNLYNSMSFCGLGMLYLHPRYRLFQTSYFQVEKATISEAYQAGKSAETWRPFLDRYRIEVVWLDPAGENASPEYYPPAEWALVYFDERSVVFLRRGGQNEALIAQHEYRVVHPAHFFGKGGEAHVDMDHRGAGISELKRALSWAPESSLLHLMLGVYLNALPGSELAALSAFEKAARQAVPSDATYAPAQFQLGGLLLDSGDVAGAVEPLRLYVARTPADSVGYVRLAEAYAQLGQHDRGIRVLRRGLKQLPQDGKMHYLLGLMLRDKGNLKGALENFRKALQFRSDKAVIHNDIGVVLAMQRDLSGAIQAFDRALALQPDFADARRNRQKAWTLLRQKNDEE